MRILVVGSCGTLGVPLVAALRAHGHRVHEVDLAHHAGSDYLRADIAEMRQIERPWREGNHYDLVYLLAAEFGRHNGEEFYEQLWRTNVIGTRNVLELQRNHGFRLIFTSSSEIYGERGDLPITEEMASTTALHQPNDYAISKWVNELQCMNFSRSGSEIVRLRLFNAYGPGEHYHRYRSVVCLFGYRMLHGIRHDVYRGYHRVFQYVDDLIETMARVPEVFQPGEVYNLGGREYVSVDDMRSHIIGCLSREERETADGCVRYFEQDEHNVMSKRPDISKAERELGHDPHIMLDVGIPRTIEWLRTEYPQSARQGR